MVKNVELLEYTDMLVCKFRKNLLVHNYWQILLSWGRKKYWEKFTLYSLLKKLRNLLSFAIAMNYN